jgi:translation initiation factor 2B subunit (eIF-2B alpha/beta/delta family)
MALAAGGCAPLTNGELHRQVTGVGAVAAEGVLLAQQVAGGRSTDNFTRVHADELAQQMDHTAEKLRETQQEDEVPGNLAEPTQRTITLAERVSGDLNRLFLNPRDHPAATATARDLQQMSNAASQLASSL